MQSEAERYPLVEQTVRDLAESVDNNPLALLGIGAAVGALVGALVMWLLARRSSGLETRAFAPGVDTGEAEGVDVAQRVEDPNSLSAVIKRELNQLLEVAVNEANQSAHELLDQQRGTLQQVVRETVRQTIAGQPKPRREA